MVRIGDPVTLELRIQPLANNRIAAPALDDKCGYVGCHRGFAAWLIPAGSRGRFTPSRTVQEEVGLREPKTSHIGLILRWESPWTSPMQPIVPPWKRKREGDIALGKGTCDLSWSEHESRSCRLLIQAAQNNQIPFSWGLAAGFRRPI